VISFTFRIVEQKVHQMSVQQMPRVEHESLVPAAEDVYDDGFLRVEHKNYYVACGGSPIKLPRTEFLIFSRLVRTPNRIVTADDLWTSVWGSNKPLNSESLHVYIYRLRAKLAEFGLQIETMVNVGYRLITQKP
jgi:DNA-binding response OmpR family regulator